MNKADLLTAAFRQLAAAKTTVRGGPASATIAKDDNDKAAQFRDQLRLIAHAAKPGAKVEAETKKTDAEPGTEEVDGAGEFAEDVTTKPKARAETSSERTSEQASVPPTSTPQEWRAGSEASLSAVISQLDQAQTQAQALAAAAAADDAATPARSVAETREAAVKLSNLPEPPKDSDVPDPRFALNMQSTETRSTAPVKVAVRDQETHFQPVRQLMPSGTDLKLPDPSATPKADAGPDQRFTLSADSAATPMTPAVKGVAREQEAPFEPAQPTSLLQRVVDRLGTELPTAPAPVAASSPDLVVPDILKPADKPVKILTLQLDPPDLGAVTVKMRLTGDAVEVRLSADRYGTTQLLQHERGALTDLMQSAGYTFDIASIDQSRAGDANAGAGQQQAQSDQRSASQSNGGSQFSGANPDRQASEGQAGTRQNRQQHEQFSERVERSQDKPVVRDRTGGAVYL